MTSTTPRIILIAVAVLALAAPAASARPVLTGHVVHTSSPAGTTSAPAQDLRNPDNRAPRYQAPGAVVRKIPERHAPWRIATTRSDTSPFAYFIPGVLLIAMLGAGLAYALTSRPVRRSPA